jgi:hypothetical protein
VIKAFPHVGQIEDKNVEQAFRLLWDRIQTCEESLLKAEALIVRLQAEAKQVDAVRRVVVRHESKLRQGV